MLEEREKRVQWVYSAEGNPEELARRYDLWASMYDADLKEAFGYLAPDRVRELVDRYYPDRTASLLDAGAGTGLMGLALAELGFHNLVAIDLSEGMLEEARKKRVYGELHRMVLGEPLGFATDRFDGVTCIGTLTLGHAPASSLDELVRVTRPGGYVIFSMRPDVYEAHGFREKQAALEAEGKWELAEVTEDFQSIPKGEPEVYARIYVYRVC